MSKIPEKTRNSEYDLSEVDSEYLIEELRKRGYSVSGKRYGIMYW